MSLSVPANVTERSKRESRTDYARFLSIAEGSPAETHYLLLLCRDLGYLAADVCASMVTELDEIARMLHGVRVKVAGHDGPT